MAAGKTQVLFSGVGTTNTFQYGSFNTLGYAKILVGVKCERLGSGIGYTVRGYPVGKVAVAHSIASGSITTSGQLVVITSGLEAGWEKIDVGVVSLQSGRSGAVTVLVAGKPR